MAIWYARKSCKSVVKSGYISGFVRSRGNARTSALSVFKSATYVSAQDINDATGQTIVTATSQEAALKGLIEGSAATMAAAKAVGEAVAERALAKGIQQVVFDRGGYLYHGKVKELAEAARAKGLQF
jgi:large subunit ribosomal protein L18